MRGKVSKFHFSSLIIQLPFYVAVSCILLFIATGQIGYRVFKMLFEEQYEAITKQIADTALSFIDCDSILRYAEKPVEDEEWKKTNDILDKLTDTAKLAYIYVTVPNERFESRIYIYDTVHPEVMRQNPKIKPYPLGKVNTLLTYDEMRLNEIKNAILKGTSSIHFVYNNTGSHVTTSIPVKDSSGKNVAILSIVKPMSEVKAFRDRYLTTTFVSSSIITVLFIIIYAFILLMRVIKPLVTVTKETAYYAQHQGELTGKLRDIKGHSEIATLARSVEKMSVDMNKYIEDLTHTTAEKERLSAELDVARQIQANMLPQIFPPYADHQELELYASMTPAKEVGGDFYDFYMVDDDHFAIVVGDVSGKGVPAALFMVVAKTLLKNGCLHEKELGKLFTNVNNQLCDGNEAGLFVTCWMGIVQISTGEMTFVNAGHTSPLIYHDDKVEYLVTKPDLMLAGLEGVKYTEHKIKLHAGDRLFVYTDGITEATNKKNELFGEERLLKACEKQKGISSKLFLKGIQNEIDSFVDGAPQFDDITMLEFILKDLEAKKTDKNKSLQVREFDATDENLEKVYDFIHSMLPPSVGEGRKNQLDLAIEEVFINIAHYAYAPDTGKVKVECECVQENDCDTVKLVFCDRGKEFNPLAKADPDITLAAEDRQIGGLGIFLTKKLMDKVEYKYSEGQNILIMTKKIVRQ